MRDRADNVVVVCSIENLDPMGVHTGDSITVAPAMTLTDREYQRHARHRASPSSARSASTPAAATSSSRSNPRRRPDHRHRDEPAGLALVARWRPRPPASRSPRSPPSSPSATPSTRSPTTSPRETPASFEPTLDYVVVKVPRFAFEKFPQADPTLTTHMKSVGEAMAIGRNFTEALQKALRSLERPGRAVLLAPDGATDVDRRGCSTAVADPARRPPARGPAGAAGRRDRRRAARGHRHRPVVPRPDPADQRGRRRGRASPPSSTAALLRRAKRHGFSDAPDRRAARAARGRRARGAPRARRPPGLQDRRHLRRRVRGPHAVPLLDLRRGDRGRAARAARRCSSSVSGPNRIGQGIEFDYSCVHAACALRERRLRDRHGQLQPRDRLDRLRHQRPALLRAADPRGRPRGRTRRAPPGRSPASSCSSAGRRRSALAQALKDAGRADRRHQPGGDPPRRGPRRVRPGARRGRAARPRHGTRHLVRRGRRGRAATIGYPVLVRPSYVLGGRGMEIVYDEDDARGLHRAGDRDQPGAPRARRPVPRRRHRDRRRRALRRRTSSTSAASWSTSRRPASTPATRRARCPRSRWGTARSSGSATSTDGDRRAASASAACSTSSTPWSATCSTCSRPTRARRGPCRSSRRRPRCRSPRRRPAS